MTDPNRQTYTDHEINISKPSDYETRWTIQAYGNGYALERLLQRDESLEAIVEHDAEAGCYFGYTTSQADAITVAEKLLELQKDAAPRKRAEQQARLENAMSEAAAGLMTGHGYSLEDLIEILTSREG